MRGEGGLLYGLMKVLVTVAVKIMFDVRVIGADNVPETGPVVLCSNHTSWWDPPLIACVIKRPVHFMAKKELFQNQFVAKVLYRVNAFPVNRSRADVGAIKQALRVLNDGNVLGVFPEGTRAKSSNGPSEMHAGAALLSLKADAPVVPVAIRGDYGFRSKVLVSVGEPFGLEAGNGRLSRDVQEGTKVIAQAISDLWNAPDPEEVA